MGILPDRQSLRGGAKALFQRLTVLKARLFTYR
jgi:hypothetical protein